MGISTPCTLMLATNRGIQVGFVADVGRQEQAVRIDVPDGAEVGLTAAAALGGEGVDPRQYPSGKESLTVGRLFFSFLALMIWPGIDPAQCKVWVPAAQAAALHAAGRRPQSKARSKLGIGLGPSTQAGSVALQALHRGGAVARRDQTPERRRSRRTLLPPRRAPGAGPVRTRPVRRPTVDFDAT